MGLIKTGLKAAVAVKVAHMVHDRIESRQHAQWAAAGHPAGMPATGGNPVGMAAAAGAAQPAPVAPPAPAAPAAASPPVHDTLAQLTQLGELKVAGVLTEEEFQAQKARILNG
jgi:Short C-terminal domain